MTSLASFRLNKKLLLRLVHFNFVWGRSRKKCSYSRPTVTPYHYWMSNSVGQVVITGSMQVISQRSLFLGTMHFFGTVQLKLNNFSVSHFECYFQLYEKIASLYNCNPVFYAFPNRLMKGKAYFRAIILFNWITNFCVVMV